MLKLIAHHIPHKIIYRLLTEDGGIHSEREVAFRNEKEQAEVIEKFRNIINHDKRTTS